jgi:hypothetical protein
MTALIGAGGKTMAMFRLAEEQREQGCNGLVTASRKVALINQAGSEAEIETARSLGKTFLSCGLDRVVVNSFTSDDPVKEVLIQ